MTHTAITELKHNPGANDYTLIRANKVLGGVSFKRSILNLTAKAVEYYEPTVGIISAMPNSNQFDLPKGVYVIYELTLPSDAFLVKDNTTLMAFPLLNQILNHGRVDKGAYEKTIYYSHYFSPWELETNNLVFDKLSSLHVGYQGADWSTVIQGKSPLVSQGEDLTTGFLQKIVYVDDHRETIYYAGFKKVAPITAVTQRASGLLGGLWVTTHNTATGEREVNYYNDVESCRDALDIPIFERYTEAEAQLVSAAEKERVRKQTQAALNERVNRRNEDLKSRRGDEEAPKRGDIILRLLDGLLLAVNTFLGWFVGKPVVTTAKR